MDIHAWPGTTVRYIGDVTQEQINWGSHVDPRELLEEGREYIIDRTEIHTWHTKVFLVGFPGKSFNSVWFE